MRKVLSVVAIVIVAVGFSACGAKKPKKLELTTQSVSINNALLDSRHTFVPKDTKLKTSNWAYEIESEIKGDYFFDNNAMVKVFLLAHNADRIIILGEGRVAKQYRNYFRNNGVDAYIDVQEIDMVPEYKNRVKIMFFSSKANYEDYRALPTYKAKPLNDESDLELDSNLDLDKLRGNNAVIVVLEKDKPQKPINQKTKPTPKKKQPQQPKSKPNALKDNKPAEQCVVADTPLNKQPTIIESKPTEPTITEFKPTTNSTTGDKQIGDKQ